MTAPSVLFDSPGPKARRRHRIIGVAGSIVLVGFLAAGVAVASAAGTRQAAADVDGRRWTYLLPGLINTPRQRLYRSLFALGLGYCSVWTRRHSAQLACSVLVNSSAVSRCDDDDFQQRAVIQLGWFDGETRPLAGVVTGLTLYNGAVITELIRSGVHSLPDGQREAGIAIGMTRSQTLMLILLPQAISAMLPSLVAQLIVVLKDTTLGYMITYPDLLRNAQNIDAVYGNIVVDFIVAGAIFYLLNWALTRLAGWLESWLRTRRVASTNEAEEQEVALATRNPALGPMYNAVDQHEQHQLEHPQQRSFFNRD